MLAMESSVRSAGDGFRIACTIEQRGNLYHIPVDIGIESRRGMRIERVELTGRRHEFSFESRDEPFRILLDRKGWVLMNVVPMRP